MFEHTEWYLYTWQELRAKLVTGHTKEKKHNY